MGVWERLTENEKAIPLNEEWYGLKVTKLNDSVVLEITRSVLACSSRPVQGRLVTFNKQNQAVSRLYLKVHQVKYISPDSTNIPSFKSFAKKTAKRKTF
jgi:hypothetical protein